MKRIKVLDCTLRDGGYLNNWQFGKGVIFNIVERLGLSGVDYIELGFLKQDCHPDLNSSHIVNINDIAVRPNNSLVVAMIEIGAYDISNIPQHDDSILIFGFRLMFRKQQLEERLRLRRGCKDWDIKFFYNQLTLWIIICKT